MTENQQNLQCKKLARIACIYKDEISLEKQQNVHTELKKKKKEKNYLYDPFSNRFEFNKNQNASGNIIFVCVIL